jgi:hypothetical protein
MNPITVTTNITQFEPTSLHDEGAFDALQKSIKAKCADLKTAPAFVCELPATATWSVQADMWCAAFRRWAIQNLERNTYKRLEMDLYTMVRTAFRKNTFKPLARYVWDGTKAYDVDDVLNLDNVNAYFSVTFKEGPNDTTQAAG